MVRAYFSEFDTEVAYRVAFADATLRTVGEGLGSLENRRLLEMVASERVSADEAVETVARNHGVRIDRQMSFTVREFDDYFIEGTSALRSRLVDDDHPFGVSNHEQFRAAERDITRIRAAQLAISPEPGRFDYIHLKAIHRRLFNDIFPWAGEQRVGPNSSMTRFARDASNFPRGDAAAPMVAYKYYSGPEIAEAVSLQLAQLEHLAERRDVSRARVVALIGEYAAELLAIHAFRDGNVRAQWIYAMQYDEHIGYPIDPFAILNEPDILDDVLHSAHHYQASGDFDGLIDATDKALGKSFRTAGAGHQVR